jgi:hypothetical protein
MNVDVEDLLCRGMERFTEEVPVPRGLAYRAARARRRRMAIRAVAGAGTAAVTAAALIAVTGPGVGPGTGGAANARTTAYVVGQVENALAAENFVIQGRATGTYAFPVHGHQVRYSNEPTSSWTYRNRWRMEEFTGSSCGHVLPNGDCTNRGGSEPYWAQGTARIGGRLLSAYVTYYDHRYSLSPLGHDHLKACSRTAQLVLGGPAVTIPNWPAFIKAMLGCQAATVTGHARIGGVQTTVISGLIDIPLSKGYARTVKESRVRVRYTLDVDSATYLPVRAYGSTETYGGAAGPTVNAYVTNVRWLPPTKGNIAKTLVTIPPGYKQVSSPASQQPG